MERDSSWLIAEGSIRKSRSRKRRRVIECLFAVLIFVGGSAAIPRSSGASTTTSNAAQETRFLQLLNKGIDGSYEATFVISGHLAAFPGSSWTVVVAHQGSHVPQTLFNGHWSYLIRTTDGFVMQWIENDATHRECWKSSTKRHGDVGRELLRRET